jgi:hypothetical protein
MFWVVHGCATKRTGEKRRSGTYRLRSELLGPALPLDDDEEEDDDDEDRGGAS